VKSSKPFAVLAAALACAAYVSPNTYAAARARASAPLAPVPGSTCNVFPSDNVWNTPIANLPVNPKNKVWKRSMDAKSTFLHPDFGPPDYGIPLTVVNDSTPTVSVKFKYQSESDPGPYPFTASTPIEQGSDRHALMINSDTCTLYELFDARWNGGSPTAGSGAVFYLSSDALRPAGWTSADAAGLPIFAGLVRWDEVQAGSIDHAIRFTAVCTRNRYIWPARHQAGVANPDCPPMGARFRLKASYDISGFSPQAQVILQAMKTYGLILADNGSNWYFQGAEDPHWTNALLDQLKTVPAKAFVAVDESACQVSANSGQAACP
jgi:hypothetical protein